MLSFVDWTIGRILDGDNAIVDETTVYSLEYVCNDIFVGRREEGIKISARCAWISLDRTRDSFLELVGCQITKELFGCLSFAP